MVDNKKIYITEEQYVSFICEILSSNTLNEGKSWKLIKKMLFFGCRSFKDYAKRILRLVEGGALIGMSTYIVLINKIPEGTPEEKEALKQEVAEKINDEPTKKNKDTYIHNDYIKHRAESFHISEEGIDHILDYEQFSAKPYNATPSEKKRGIFTIGYGHKMSSSEYIAWTKNPYSLSKKEARELFKKDLAAHERDFIDAMNSLPKSHRNPNLYSQGFVDAGVSIVFNAGKGNFMKSGLYKTIPNCRIKNGVFDESDYNVLLSKIKTACATQEGKPCKGLVNRRKVEYNMAYNNDYTR